MDLTVYTMSYQSTFQLLWWTCNRFIWFDMF